MATGIHRAGLATLTLLGACSGIIDTKPAGSTTGSNVGTGLDVAAACATPTRATSPGTKLVRLTHTQYDNTVRDLLGIDTKPSLAFQKDPTFHGFDNSAVGLDVEDRLGRDYRRAAEDLSVQVAATSATRSKVVPCSATTDACAKQFISTFGARAFRRPLSDPEQAAYLALFKQADAFIDGTDPFAKGVQVTVEAMLQSPHFLYRVELAEQAPTDGLVPLSGYEMASRLSYLLWNSMPDAALFDAAAKGALSDEAQLTAQAQRLLDDPRAQTVVDDFHRQFLELSKDYNLNRDPTLYPNFSAAVSPMMEQETLRFIRQLIFVDQAPFAALYTAPYSFVNKELAALYKVSGTFSSTEYTKVTLDPTQRRGLLTQIGFLASHAYARTDSPIHRGVFIVRKVLGLPQGDPPPGIDFTLPPIGSGEIKTTRQQVTAKTSPAGCATCHDRINSLGFAFEHYDAVGQYRTQENNVDVDSSGTMTLGDQPVAYQNALDFTTAVSTSAEARISYATNWLRFGYQRVDTSDDTCDLTKMAVHLGEPELPHAAPHSRPRVDHVVSLSPGGDRHDATPDPPVLVARPGRSRGRLAVSRVALATRARAAPAAAPKRFVAFFECNGVNMSRFFPATPYGARSRRRRSPAPRSLRWPGSSRRC